MKCPGCKANNPPGNRFCGQCGAGLMAACPGCGEPVQPDHHLCVTCGWLLRGERRQVTVAFSDLVGSTQLASAIDPEDFRDLIKSYYSLCVDVVEGLGGHIANFLGDGVLIFFGYPTAYEDAAERAVSAGLEILQSAGSLATRTGEPVRLRVGIATGLLVVDGKGQIEDGVYGETTNLAARIQSAAEPDTVVIADSTRRLIGHRFSLLDLGEARLKGFSAPIGLWRPLQPKASQTRFRALSTGSEVGPLCGREKESATLTSAWQQACLGRSQMVHLVGEAGIGKSRLAKYALDLVRSEQGRQDSCVLQCSPLQTQSALFPVREWLRRVALEAVEGNASPESLERGLRHLIARALPGDDAALPLLAILLRLEVDLPAELLATTPESRRQQTQQRLKTLLAGRADTPRLILMEDLHWADPSTLELLGGLAATLGDQPVMVLTTMRPERLPPDWRGPPPLKLTLDRLHHDAAMAVAGHASAGVDLPPHLLERIVAQTDGVPLFVEEMARSVMESWSPAPAEGTVRGGFDPQLPIPGSLNDSLLSRLDRMVQGKAVAQMASMLGRDLSHEVLAAVWPGSPEVLSTGIAQLEKSQILHSHDHEGTRTYSFRHALIRDAAYESILRTIRVEQHRSIAEVLERKFPAMATLQPELLAQHFAAAHCGEQACNYRVAAAQAALQQNAHLETVAHVQSGLDLLPLMTDEQLRIASELELRVCAIPALLAAKGYGDPEVQEYCERSLNLCDRLPDSPKLVVALFGLWTFHVVRANHKESLDLARRFLNLALTTGNDDLLLEADLINGIANFFVGETRTATRHLESVVERYDRERHASHRYQFGQDPAAVAMAYLSWTYWISGQPSRARSQADKALQLSEKLDHPFTHSFVLSLTGWHAMLISDHERASRLTAADLAICTAQDLLVFLAHGKVLDAMLRQEHADAVAATDTLEAAIEFFRATGARCFLTHWEAALGRTRAAQGDWQGAHQSIEQAFARMESSNERWAEPELHRLHGEALERQGTDPEIVETQYRRAIESAARLRSSGWGLRAGLSLATSLGRRGREQEALDTLEAALNPFLTEGGGDRTVMDARQLLADLQQRISGRAKTALSGRPEDP